jgi:hypothetical protein
MNSESDRKLSLEWVKTKDGRVALVFDQGTWRVFEETAKARDKTAEHMILTARSNGTPKSVA